MGTTRANRKRRAAHCRRRPGLPGRSSVSWWQKRLDESRQPCPERWPRGSPPGRQIPRYEFPLAAYHLRLFHESLPQRFGVLRSHHGLVVRAVAVYELADDDLPGHGQANFIGRRAVPDFALLFVVLHGVETIAQLVTALIQRGTGRDHFDKGEAFLLKRLADGARKLAYVKRGPARDINRARRLDQVRQIERWLEHTVRIRGSSRVIRSGGSGLAASHGVDQIVHADDLQINVAACGVDQMIAPDGRKVAVTGIDDDVQLWVCQFEPGGERDGAAVRGMERIQFDVARHAPSTADARDQGQRL